MASKIKITQPSRMTGLSISQEKMRLGSDSSNLNILDVPQNTSASSTMDIPPKGPDGRYLIKDPHTQTWREQSNTPSFPFDEINEVTDNGKDTSGVFKDGLKNKKKKKKKDKSTLMGALAFGASLLLAAGKKGSGGSSSDSPNSSSHGNNVDMLSVANASTNAMGQQLWQYEVKLFNHAQDVYPIPTHAIKQLCIEEDLMSWPMRGYIILDATMEGFERSQDFNSFYFLRSDARDEIRIEIKPIVDKGEMPDEIWTIVLEGCIYDVEDLDHSDFTNKCKKLYFWDKKFQGLNEKKIQWSTATGERIISDPCPKPESHATDYERSMFTGEAIASLLHEAGYTNYIGSDEWDFGKTKILFNTKPNWTLWECIQYILSQHISNDDKEDICMFIWNRGQLKWNLIPMWRIFEDAGSERPGSRQIEHMFFEENVTDEQQAIVPFLAPIDLQSTSKVKDIKSDEYNKIATYRFSQSSGLDNSKAMISRPVYSYWNKNKQFNMDIKDNDISKVRDTFKKNYVASLLSKDKSPIFPLNKTKTENVAVENSFSPVSNLESTNDRKIRKLSGIGKTLFAGIFLNSSMSIRVKGSTHRIAGTFIGVDRMNTSSDTYYDYQVCGQYLNINVRHIIQSNIYVNDITMVKIHSYKQLPVNEGIE